ncbi:MAG TPA: hypothetical protein VFJ84_02035 [Candidatus Saccharimonadales bacterium]|nr:hypothetical protein [Candidatus Saccharimonadales bacterium]
MTHELPQEIGRDIAVSAADIWKPRKQLLAKVGLSLGVMAAALTAATARPNKAQASPSEAAAAAHPLEYVGITSNRIWVPDLNQARQAAHDIADTNANTVRIFQPYNQSQAEFSFDLPRLCNAAEAARENNLILEITTLGVQSVTEKGKKVIKHNYVPSNAGGVSRYLSVVKTMLMDIAGPDTAHSGPGGTACVEQPLDKVMIGDFDEVNSEDFNSNIDPAKKYAYLESKAIPTYAKISDDINHAFEGTPHSFTLEHVVGALAVSHHDYLGFLKDFDQALKGFGVTDPDFLLAVHPYPADSTVNPATIEAAINPLLRDELDAAWGKDRVSVFFDEIGVSAIPDKKRSQYGTRSLQAAAVKENLQAQYYSDTIHKAAQLRGVVGILTFQSQDVSNDGWPSGLYSPDNTPKKARDAVASAFYDTTAH